LTQLLELAGGDNRPTLNEAPSCRRDRVHGPGDGVRHQCRLLDPQIGVDAHDAAHGPAKVDVGDSKVSLGARARRTDGMGVVEGVETARLGDFKELELAVESQPFLFEEMAKGAVDQNGSRKIRNSGEARTDYPVHQLVQALAGIECGGTEENRYRGTRQ